MNRVAAALERLPESGAALEAFQGVWARFAAHASAVRTQSPLGSGALMNRLSTEQRVRRPLLTHATPALPHRRRHLPATLIEAEPAPVRAFVFPSQPAQ